MRLLNVLNMLACGSIAAGTAVIGSHRQEGNEQLESSTGIFAIKQFVWRKDAPALITALQADPTAAWRKGDIWCYYVEPPGAAEAFSEAHKIEIENFVLSFRSFSGTLDSVIWFIFDFGLQSGDMQALDTYLRNFNAWVADLEVRGLRAAVGKIGVGINVEDTAAGAVQHSIRKSGLVRDQYTKLAIMAYSNFDYYGPHYAWGLLHADVVLVRPSRRNAQMSVVDRVAEFKEAMKIASITQENHATLQFTVVAVEAGLRAEQTLAGEVYRELTSVLSESERETFIEPRTFMVAYGWERWVQ